MICNFSQLDPFYQSFGIVGSVSIPAAVGQLATGIPAGDLLMQAPVLGILVIVVYLFLKHIKSSEESRRSLEREAIAIRSETERIRSQDSKKLSEECHTVQRDSIQAMTSLKAHIEQESVVRKRTIEVLDRLERRLDIEEAKK